MKLEKTNQKSALSTRNKTSIPLKWQERFIIKRIKEGNILISLEERNAILQEMARGTNFVQVGKYTLMINSIKSIDPYWGPSNIPPRPSERPKKFEHKRTEINGQTVFVRKETEESRKEREAIKKEQEEWDKIFGKRLLGETDPPTY